MFSDFLPEICFDSVLMNTPESLQTDGFEFVEYTAPDSRQLEHLFSQMGFRAIARHRSKEVVLYRQGHINFIINHEPDSFAQSFAKLHGPSICAFAIRVNNAADYYRHCLNHGAKAWHSHIGPMELNIPAIRGIGNSLIYLVDRYHQASIYDVDFIPVHHDQPCQGSTGLEEIDHLTHNVYHGKMDSWAEFYQRLFDFKEIRYFDIHGKLTGLKSRAMTSPCGKIRIPINEPSDTQSQIQEYLDAYHGEGIQHIALHTNNIYDTVTALKLRNIKFMDVPDSYYQQIAERLPEHGEDLELLRKHRILIDGAKDQNGELLLQIFTHTVIGPIFFEIIQRKGDQGFGEGNFKALFEAIERDQMQRGAIG